MWRIVHADAAAARQPVPRLIRCSAAWLRRTLPVEVLRELERELDELGRQAGGELYRLQLADRLNEPTLTQWDAWGAASTRST